MSEIVTIARKVLAKRDLDGSQFCDEHDETCACIHPHCLIEGLVAEIARLREERRWVSVGERLPEEGVEVLWCNSDDQDRCVYVGKRDRSLIVWGSDEWVIGADFTHWHPLPPWPEPKEANRE